MRIVHTSDWHLGRTFGGQSLHDHQEAFVAWLVELVRAEQASLVVVAGDVYDRSIPAAEAVALFGRALRALRDAGAQVVAIAGNHDSPERLSAYDGLTDLAGVYIRGGYARAGEAIHLELPDGPLDVVAVPFLEPSLAPEGTTTTDAPVGPDDTTGRATHRAVLQRAVEQARVALRAPRSLVVAHAFVAGASSSESERTLSVGGGALVPASVFEGFSYAALGHLHKPQALGDTVRYSGSPLAYSFSEQHPKQVIVVDLDARGAATVRPVVVDVGRRVATVRGTLDEVLSDPRHAGVEGNWVRAVLTDTTYVIDAKARLQRRFPHVVEVVMDPVHPASDAGATTEGRGRDLSPLHNAVEFWHDTTGEQATPAVVHLLTDALETALIGDALSRRISLGSVASVLARADAGDALAGSAPSAPAPTLLDVEEPAAHPPASATAHTRKRRPVQAETLSLFDDDAMGHAS
jgi:exonuclease SbcD